MAILTDDGKLEDDDDEDGGVGLVGGVVVEEDLTISSRHEACVYISIFLIRSRLDFLVSCNFY